MLANLNAGSLTTPSAFFNLLPVDSPASRRQESPGSAIDLPVSGAPGPSGVTPDIARLLSFGASGRTRERRGASVQAAFQPPPAAGSAATATAAAKNDTAAASHPGFARQPLDQLLDRYRDSALEHRPGRCRVPIPPPERLMGRMLEALKTAPDRAEDLQRLRNASYALAGFFERLKQALETVSKFKPARAEAARAAAADLARQAVALARALPLDPSGQAVYDIASHAAINALVPEPEQLLAQAEAWLHARAVAADTEKTRVFFDDEVQNQVRGARAGRGDVELDESFRRGHITFNGSPADLREALRHVPAGALKKDAEFAGTDNPAATWHAVYAAPGWENNLQAVFYELPDGRRTEVMVALHNNVHSFSVTRGHSWRPTGAAHSPELEAYRLECWKKFLARRT